MTRIAMLGTGLIGDFYAATIHGRRSRDQIVAVYSRSAERAEKFAEKYRVAFKSTSLEEVVARPDVDAVVVALPNDLHESAVLAASAAGKAVLCTKPLGRTAAEARRMLEAVERAGVFHGYLEDLCYTPKTLKSLDAVGRGAVGKVLWVRSRETHSGPHSSWFWDPAASGGGAMIDLGCHCVEIARSFIGKDVRPVEVMCWADTQVHPISVEDHAVGLVRYANGAVGQFEVSWAFRGGMDLRDEVAGTEGTIWLNHWLRTGLEMFSSGGTGDYVAEKAEGATGWLFPVGDETGALGYGEMFDDMFNCLDRGATPRETFYDGWVVNAILDAAYASAKSKRWEPVDLPLWRGATHAEAAHAAEDYDAERQLVKRERMPDGTLKLILRDKRTGKISELRES
jgi:predicted dehydrogenase